MPYAWLGAGAVSLGIGAASIAGSAVARADDSGGATATSTASAEGSESASATTPSTEPSIDKGATDHGSNTKQDPADKPAAKVGDGRNGITKSPPTSQDQKHADATGTSGKTVKPGDPAAMQRRSAPDDEAVHTGPKKPAAKPESATEPTSTTPASPGAPASPTEAASSFLAATADPPKTPAVVQSQNTTVTAAKKSAPSTTTPTASVQTTFAPTAVQKTATLATTPTTTPTAAAAKTIVAPQVQQAAAPTPVSDPFAPVRDWIFKTFLNQTPTVSVVPGQTILANGTIKGMVAGADADGDVLTYTASRPAGGGSVAIASDGSFVYTPGASFTGADTFTVTVDDDTPVNGWHVHGLLGLLFPGLGSTATADVSVLGKAAAPTTPTTPTSPTNPKPPTTGTPSGSASAAVIYGWGDPVTGLSDEFDGTGTPDAFWNLYRSAGHAGNGLRRPEQITEQNGYLQIAGTSNATSGGMMSAAVYPAYGRWEVSMRVDKQGAGNPYHSVIALIPYGVPYDNGAGDLDFSEADVDDGRAYVFVHHPTNKQSYASVPLDLAQWHTYSIEVAPDHISWFVDGKVQMTTTNRAAITGTRWTTNVQLDAFYPGGLAPSNMQVDYFRFYQLPASGAPVVPAPAPAIGNYP